MRGQGVIDFLTFSINVHGQLIYCRIVINIDVKLRHMRDTYEHFPFVSEDLSGLANLKQLGIRELKGPKRLTNIKRNRDAQRLVSRQGSDVNNRILKDT